MQAKVKQSYTYSTVRAHTGRTYTKKDWRYAPDNDAPCSLLDYRETAVSEEVEADGDGIIINDDPVLAVDIEDMNIKELRQLAKKAKIKGYGRMGKARLIFALRDD